MATDPRVLLDAAFASYGDTPPEGYNSTGQTITNKAGLYATVYRKIGAEEYIFAFRGTEQTLADFNTDVHKGWPQYENSDDAEMGNTAASDVPWAMRWSIFATNTTKSPFNFPAR